MSKWTIYTASGQVWNSDVKASGYFEAWDAAHKLHKANGGKLSYAEFKDICRNHGYYASQEPIQRSPISPDPKDQRIAELERKVKQLCYAAELYLEEKKLWEEKIRAADERAEHWSARFIKLCQRNGISVIDEIAKQVKS